MASIIYDSMLDDLVKGVFDFDNDSFYVMLVTSTYSPNKGTHNRRDDVTNEVVGTGYTSGGVVSTTTINSDTTNHREDISFSNVSWATATITARAAVIYCGKGGASSGDPLIACVDFGQDVSSTAAAFSVTFSSALRFQN